MSFWNPLLQAALIGTDRPWKWQAIANDPHNPNDPSNPIAQLLNEVHAAAPHTAGTLLRLAGVTSVCQQAGWKPPAAPANPTNPIHSVNAGNPVAAEGESRTEINSLWEKMLSELLEQDGVQGTQRLQQQILFAIDQKKWRVPYAMLIPLLELGRQSKALRPYVQPVIGERGRWLAQQNPQWSYAVGASEQADVQTQWEHGTLEQRCAVLRTERASAPDAARARLETDWRNLPAKERAALIAILQVGLSPADEPFLTQQLKDRGQDVRNCAADLLAVLPNSAYSLRMIERMTALVVDGIVHPPEEIDASWDDDQLEATRPKYHPLGERAWRLYQLVRRTPLGWWTQHTGKSPEDWIELAKQSKWADALLRGWTDALKMQPLSDWYPVLLFNNPYVEPLAACLRDCPDHTYLELSLSQKLEKLVADAVACHSLLDFLCVLHPQSLSALASSEIIATVPHAAHVIRIRNHIFEALTQS